MTILARNLDKNFRIQFLHLNLPDILIQLKLLSCLQPVGNHVDNLIFTFRVNKNDWWRKHETELPHWSKACKMVLLVQPSSAAAESFFSSFKQFYGAANVVIGGLHRNFLMLQYNKQNWL